jgi:hypothetical protein
MWLSKPMTSPEDRARPPSSPIPAAAHQLDAPTTLAPEQYRDLLDYLAEIADPVTGAAGGTHLPPCWPSGAA